MKTTNRAIMALIVAFSLLQAEQAWAQQPTPAASQGPVTTTDPSQLGRLIDRKEEAIPARGNRPATTVITETYERGTIRRYRTAEALELRFPAANPGEFTREKDEAIDHAFEILGHADPDTQQGVALQLSKFGKFSEWYAYLVKWSEENKYLLNSTPGKTVTTGEIGTPQIVTPPTEWIRRVQSLGDGHVVRRVGQGLNPVIKEGFKDDASLIEMSKGKNDFTDRIRKSHLAGCQIDQMLQKLSTGDFAKLHPLMPPEGDENGWIYIDENFGSGVRVTHGQIMQPVPGDEPVMVVTLHLDACDAAPPQVYDIIQGCANPMKRYQEVVKPISTRITEFNTTVKPLEPKCTAASLSPKSIGIANTELTLTAIYANLPNGIDFTPQAVYQGAVIASGSRNTNFVKFAASLIPGLGGETEAQFQVSFRAVDEKTGKVLFECPGSLDSTVSYQPPQCVGSQTFPEKSSNPNQAITISGKFARIPSGVKYYPVVVYLGREIARGKANTDVVQFPITKIPGFTPNAEAHYDFGIRLVEDKTGRVIAECPGSVGTGGFTFTPPPKQCETCAMENHEFRVGKDGARLNVSDFVPRGTALKPGSAKWEVNGNPFSTAISILVTTAELEKLKEIQFTLTVETVDGCIIVCHGRLKKSGGKWWIWVLVGAGVAAGILAATQGGSKPATKDPKPTPGNGCVVGVCN